MAIACLLPTGAMASAPLRDGDIDITAPSAILMEKETGEVLYEKDAHSRGFPASVTKVMTMLLGTLLLNLPAASRNGVSAGFLPALFTATSATCVTGLSLFDTWSQWSGFGQIVLLCLIQTGGLGFMSAATMVVFILRRRIGLKQRLVMAQALSVGDINGIVRLQKMVLKGNNRGFGINRYNRSDESRKHL